MTHTASPKIIAVIAAFTVIVVTGMTHSTKSVGAHVSQAPPQNGESAIQRGLDIAPVLLNLKGKNRALVGLGSYIVNAVGDCNGCHSAGPPSEFASGGNPYLRSPFFSGTKKINTATYLGGGRDFGPSPTFHTFIHVT